MYVLCMYVRTYVHTYTYAYMFDWKFTYFYAVFNRSDSSQSDCGKYIHTYMYIRMIYCRVGLLSTYVIKCILIDQRMYNTCC